MFRVVVMEAVGQMLLETIAGECHAAVIRQGKSLLGLDTGDLVSIGLLRD